jgi:hypothetical protein
MRILFFQHTVSLGGASWSLLQLVERVCRHHEVIVALPKEGPLAAELRSMGIQALIRPALTTLENAPGGLRWVLDIQWVQGLVRRRGAVKEARRLCRAVNPDLVHINTMVYFHLAIGVKQAGPIPVVQHIREHWFPWRFDPRNRVRQMAFSCIDRVISITHENAKGFGYPGSTTVVHNWPDFSGRDSPLSVGGCCRIPSHKKIVTVHGVRLFRREMRRICVASFRQLCREVW